MGIGDWGLANPQSQIPNPQSQIPNHQETKTFNKILFLILKNIFTKLNKNKTFLKVF